MTVSGPLRLRGRAGHLASALFVALLLAGPAASAAPAIASVAACAGPDAPSGPSAWIGSPEPLSPGTTENQLTGVTVLSHCDAWAVGYYAGGDGVDQTLTEHWDGAAWTVVPSPGVAGRNNELAAVRADSPTDVWAVGVFAEVNVGDQTFGLYCCA